ncbi:small ribosomal subunit protein bS18m isoform X2 [Periplaneta americana]|uniref:small ribosomal subunit protein bS18m isoform X2 n=1 Tax=Periplaneta americana TaxID=6978 RepID=UPI0037E83198
MNKLLFTLSRKLQNATLTIRYHTRDFAALGGGEIWRNTDTPKSELNEEIIKAREKDMPIEDIENPFKREKVQCILCQYKIVPDYKNVKLLSQFVSPYTGRTYGRHITRLCAAQQARVEKEIIKAQTAASQMDELQPVHPSPNVSLKYF